MKPARTPPSLHNFSGGVWTPLGLTQAYALARKVAETGVAQMGEVESTRGLLYVRVEPSGMVTPTPRSVKI